jgi:hypothetical protein
MAHSRRFGISEKAYFKSVLSMDLIYSLRSGAAAVFRAITAAGCDPDGKINLASLKVISISTVRTASSRAIVTVEQVVDATVVQGALQQLGLYRHRAGLLGCNRSHRTRSHRGLRNRVGSHLNVPDRFYSLALD